MINVLPSMAATTSSGSTPGSATKIRSSCSVSSTSMGGSQAGPPLCGTVKSLLWSRSARVSDCIASDNIQLNGSFVDMRHGLSTQSLSHNLLPPRQGQASFSNGCLLWIRRQRGRFPGAGPGFESHQDQGGRQSQRD